MSDNFGLKIGIEGEKQFKNSLRDINQKFRVLGSEMKLVTAQFDKQDNSIEAVAARNKSLNSQIDAQKDKITTLTKALDNASDSFGDTDKRTQNWQIQLNKAKAELIKFEREVEDNNKSLDGSADEFKDAGNQADKFGDSIIKSADQAETAERKFDGLKSVMGGVAGAIAGAVAAIGAAVIGTAVSLVKFGDEYNNAVNQISASTGATGEELDSLGKTAQKVYKHNFGENLEDVANGISEVRKITGLMGDNLEKATESGFALRDTFGFEIQESARAANALIKNFGISAEEAYNIIAVGAQNGANQNGDLLDTLNEYSVQYSALGLSADEFIASLIGGSKAGVFSIDKVGDAVKEFNIRAKDGSNTSIEAFKALGLNAEEMTAKFAKGGETANEAFYSVIDSLNKIEDPVKKNTIGVQLFGTQFEDLEANILPILSSMKDSTLENADALSQITSVKYNNLTDGLEGVKRSLQGAFLPTVSGIAGGITTIFSNLSNGINEADGDFSKISSVIGSAIGDISSIITQELPKFVTLGLDIIKSVGTAIVDNLPIIIDAAVNIVFTILEAVIEALPQITEGALQLVLALVEGLIQNLPVIVEAALVMITSLATGLADALPELIPSVIQAVLTIVDTLIKNMPMLLQAAFALIKGLTQGLINALPILVESLPELIIAIINFITENLPEIIEMGIEVVISLAVGLIQAIPSLIGELPKILTAIISGLSEGFSMVKDVGINLVKGLWEGISSMASWVGDKVSGFISGIVGTTKDDLDINSPSGVYEDIGENMGFGLGGGFVASMKKVQQDITGAIPTDFDIVGNVAYESGNPLSASSGMTINHTGTIVVEGINNRNELIETARIIIEDFLPNALQAEARV